MSVKDYNKEASLNVSISGINIAEGCAPSGINDAIRQLMADVKEESEAQADAVAEAVAGAAADASGKVSSLNSTLRALIAQEVAKCLKLNGGTMTGAIKRDGGDLILNAANYGALYICGGPTRASGSYIMLKPQGHNNNSGEMSLVAVSADGSTATLNLRGDGTFTWGGSSVLTSAGGTMSGAASLSFPSGSLTYGNDARVSRWIAGGAISKGPRIDLHGADFDTQPGIINFIARNSAASSQMILNPSRGLVVDNNPVLTSANGLLFPNFSSYTDIAISTSDVTMPFSGWLCSPSTVSSHAPTLIVNGVDVLTFGGSNTSGTAVAVPVKKGDTVRISSKSYTFRLFSLAI